MSTANLYIESVNLNANSVFTTNTFKLYDLTNGTKYDLTNAVSNVNSIKLTLSDDIKITSTSKFVVKADTVKTLAAFDTYKFKLKVSASDLTIKELTDDKAVTDITPATLTMKAIEGTASALSLNVTNQSAKTVVVGAKAQDVMSFEVESKNDASDLIVKELTVK